MTWIVYVGVTFSLSEQESMWGILVFPNELVICTGEILEINEKTETLKVKYLNGSILGNWEISFREAFILNYQRQPLYNPPKEEN